MTSDRNTAKDGGPKRTATFLTRGRRGASARAPGPCRSGPGPARGFTLLELVIVVAIVGVLAAVAYPSYLSSVRKGRRAEAVGALVSLQQAQERYRANAPAYTTSLADLAARLTTPGGYYTIAVDSADAAGYVVLAQAAPGRSQAGDTGCTTMRLQVVGGDIFYGGCDACSAPAAGSTLSDPNHCWAR